jgi:hypothetical protein
LLSAFHSPDSACEIAETRFGLEKNDILALQSKETKACMFVLTLMASLLLLEAFQLTLDMALYPVAVEPRILSGIESRQRWRGPEDVDAITCAFWSVAAVRDAFEVAGHGKTISLPISPARSNQSTNRNGIFYG